MNEANEQQKTTAEEIRPVDRNYLNALYAFHKVEVSDRRAKIEFLKRYTGYTNSSCKEEAVQLNALEIAVINEEKIP